MKNDRNPRTVEMPRKKERKMGTIAWKILKAAGLFALAGGCAVGAVKIGDMAADEVTDIRDDLRGPVGEKVERAGEDLAAEGRGMQQGRG